MMVVLFILGFGDLNCPGFPPFCPIGQEPVCVCFSDNNCAYVCMGDR